MPKDQLPAPSATTGGPESNWELAHQWQKAWRALKWMFTAVTVIGFLMVIGQGFLFFDILAAIHPLLGWVFVAVLALLLVFLVGRPLASFLSTPVVAAPSDAILDPIAPTSSALTSRLKYDLKYLKAMRRNPGLKDRHADIETALAEGKTLLSRAGSVRGEAARLLAQEIVTFEQNHIEALLTELDAEVDRIIHTEAVAVGVATAISMNGTVDAFIVLWRNANLVSRISRIYFGRPHFRGSLIILRDVAAIVVISRALEDVTRMTGEVIGGLLGRMGGLVAGPVMDGGINAMMTLKLGYLAKRRCRSFQAWAPEQTQSIAAAALAGVRRESGSVISELIKQCGGLTASAARATESAMSGSKNAWNLITSWFGARPAKG